MCTSAKQLCHVSTKDFLHKGFLTADFFDFDRIQITFVSDEFPIKRKEKVFFKNLSYRTSICLCVCVFCVVWKKTQLQVFSTTCQSVIEGKFCAFAEKLSETAANYATLEFWMWCAKSCFSINSNMQVWICEFECSNPSLKFSTSRKISLFCHLLAFLHEKIVYFSSRFSCSLLSCFEKIVC